MMKHIKWFNVIIFITIIIGLIALAEQLVMPDMTSWGMDEVKHYEAGNDIELSYETTYSDQVMYGEVISQRQCSEEETCDLMLTVSKGKDISAYNKEDAQHYLVELINDNLITTKTITYEQSTYSNEVEKDHLISYSADPYLDQIHLNFSLGKEVFVETATLVAAGDVLLHDTVFQDFQTGESSYNFDSLFELVKAYVEPADFALVNQESNIGGSELGVSSYPNFNSPHEIVDTLASIGFNMFSRANNHTLDKGVDGILSASAKYDSMENIIHAGATDSQEKRDEIAVMTQNGISIALLSYTYGFNGYMLPEDMTYLGNLFDETQALKDIEAGKQVADMVLVSMHWGTEYTSLPTELQQEQAQWLADQGVDVVIGHHPHVLQPITTLQGKEGNETLIVYSLGNFVSGQTGLEKNVGGLVQFDITKTTVGDEAPSIDISNVSFMPTYNYPKGRYSDYVLEPLSVSPQKSYFSEVESLMKTYDETINVVKFLSYDK